MANRKLHKNFLASNQTVETMWDSCLNGCSCGLVSCYCNIDQTDSYSVWNKFQNQNKNAFKNGAY